MQRVSSGWTFLFPENCPPFFASSSHAYIASLRFSSSPGIPTGLSRKGSTRPFMGCSFGRVATSADQSATLVRRNWHQGHRWSRLLLRPVSFEIMSLLQLDSMKIFHQWLYATVFFSFLLLSYRNNCAATMIYI